MSSRFSSRIEIRPSDIDYNGHVHHSHYLDFLLTARMDQMGRCYKMGHEDFFERGWTWMVRNYTIEYKRPLKLGDFATVTTWVIGMGNPEMGRRAQSIATIGYEISIGDSGKIAAAGQATYVMVDIHSGRAVVIPQEIIDKYSV